MVSSPITYVAGAALFIAFLALIIAIVAETTVSKNTTDKAITSSVLSGFSSKSGELSANDSILSAIEKLNGNETMAEISVKEANGFGNAIGPELTLTVTPIGLLKGNGVAIESASSNDITGQLLTGYVSGAGTVAPTDSILEAFNKLNGNSESGVSVAAANGFGATSGTTLTMTVTPVGLLKSNGTAVSAATASDITGQLITGYVSGAGTVSATDSILEAINKLNGNTSLYVKSDGSTAITGDLNCTTKQVLVADGQPCSSGKFVVSYPDFNATTTETSMLATGTKGSQTYAINSVSAGFVLRFRSFLFIGNLDAGRSFTLRLKNTTNTLITHVYTPLLTIVNEPCYFEVESTVFQGFVTYSVSRIYRDNQPVSMATGAGNWLYTTTAEMVDVTIQLENALDGIALQSAYFESLFQGIGGV